MTTSPSASPASDEITRRLHALGLYPRPITHQEPRLLASAAMVCTTRAASLVEMLAADKVANRAHQLKRAERALHLAEMADLLMRLAAERMPPPAPAAAVPDPAQVAA